MSDQVNAAAADLPCNETLRDRFAVNAMLGWLSSFPSDTAVSVDFCARFSYEMADAMLKARSAQVLYPCPSGTSAADKYPMDTAPRDGTRILLGHEFIKTNIWHWDSENSRWSEGQGLAHWSDEGDGPQWWAPIPGESK